MFGNKVMVDNSNKRRTRASRPRGGFRAAVPATGAVAVAAVAAALTGCSATSSSVVSAPPPAQLKMINGVQSVVLTTTGAERIGLRTAKAASGQGGVVTIPYSALLYEPNGQAAVYVPNGQLAYTRHLVTVDVITGNDVLVTSGVMPGESVVTSGAEELLGVQNGVGEET